MVWTFLSEGWRVDPDCLGAGAWGRMVTLEIAALSANAGTWPFLERRLCNPALLARAGGLAGEQPAHIKHGIICAISAGLLQPSADRTRIRIATHHVCVGVSVEYDGINRLEVKTAGGITVRNEETDENLACFFAVTPGDAPSVSSVITYDSDLFPEENTQRERERASEQAKPVLEKKAKRKSSGRPPAPDSEELGVFHTWRHGCDLNANTKFSAERITAVRRANRKLGFTMEQLHDSVRGWVIECKRNDWRMERRSRHELALFLRDTARIEQGLEHFHKATGIATPKAPSPISAPPAKVEAMIAEMIPMICEEQSITRSAARAWIISNCEWAHGASEKP